MIGVTVISARIVKPPGCDGGRRTSRKRILPLRQKCPSQTSARGSACAAAKSYGIGGYHLPDRSACAWSGSRYDNPASS